MPITISRPGVFRKEELASVIAVSGVAAQSGTGEAKAEPAFRVGPEKGEADIIAVPLR
jgi:hypothetical protein